MQFDGNVAIKAPIDEVWNFLIDPEKVSQCAPGLESMEITVPEKKFRAVASIGVGNIKARFTVDVEWQELDAPNFAKMKAHGTAPGSVVDAISEMRLSEDAEGTKLNWSAEVNILGTIASLASRMMDSVSQKLAGQFFNCVKSNIEK